MTQEDPYSELEDKLKARLDSPEDPNDDTSANRRSVREMILRFEKTASFSSSRSGSLSMSSIVNPIHAHFQHPVPKSRDRNSTVSVNSILSNTSELSNESSSSGFISDWKSSIDYPVPLRPAPPPPKPFDDESLENSKSSEREENKVKERRYSFATPNTSPVVQRRVRQPPVIRRKSLVGGKLGDVMLWSHGVTQSELEKLLRLTRSVPSDNEDEMVNNGLPDTSDSETSDDDTEFSEKSEHCTVHDDTKVDTMSTDRSTDTLINDGEDSVNGDSSDAASDISCARSNYDNVSIKSISSFDMVPCQKYDSITVSSDEFGSEVCHAPDKEFLTPSAVNEWCLRSRNLSALTPVESKKEKYRRRMTERVNELIHTEKIYTERLRHVVEDYIPEIVQDDVPPSLRVLKPDIFANIEKIHRFHKEEFLPALEDCENDLRKLGQCFRKYEQKFNMYVMYSMSNKRATRLVFEHKEFFQEKQLQLGDRLDLSSYLLEPVQRIPRYKLFLNDLVNTYTNYENERAESDSRISKLSVASDETGGSNGEPEPDETPLESLKLALAMIECMLTAIDGIIALENIRDCPVHINLLTQGRLLRQGEFYAMDSARRRRQLMRIFLFDKLVLLTVVYRKQQTVELFLYKDHIPVDDLGITAKEQEQFKFSIWYKKRNLKSYKLEAPEPAVRNAWVDDITNLLWEQALQKKGQVDEVNIIFRDSFAFDRIPEFQMKFGDNVHRRDRVTCIVVSSYAKANKVSYHKLPVLVGPQIDMTEEMLQQQRSQRLSTISSASQESVDMDKYNSLRGVPGEVGLSTDSIPRRTTWYCE